MILERKKVYTFREYIDFICSWWGDNWRTNDDLELLRKTHGIPTFYPAIVWIEEEYDSEPTWGSGYSNKVYIIDDSNVTIKRRKGHDE